ncbi:184_t:CDS:2 [Paraglomus brasilianum]|uniref:184_t:CDS:1 n=1 Tax=Paraglomus brasilianum TaxID=144538 RepID=A0A9N9CB52_9GLOM|nr:184_t:CDS:2 [Paraglomus brasilianum]
MSSFFEKIPVSKDIYPNPKQCCYLIPNDGNAKNNKTKTDMVHSETVKTEVGASANHFCALHAWLYRTYTAINLEFSSNTPRPRIIIYDLGLDGWQIALLNSLKSAGVFTELRKFDFSKYPDFWNIKVNAGEYGWKVGILSELVRDFPGILVWLDSGSFMRTPFLRNIEKLLKNDKCIASPKSSSTLFRWTHPGVYAYYGVPRPEKFRYVDNCSAGVLVFNTHTASKLFGEWLDCALHKDCIAPEGSSRKNHRQDQAALTYLSAREGCFCRKTPIEFNVMNHMDRNCAENIVRFEQLNSVPWNISEGDRLQMKRFKGKRKGYWWKMAWEVIP